MEVMELLAICLVMFAASVHCCPSPCQCVDLTVDCSSRSLNKVPEGIPENVTELLLDHNRICSLDGSEFENLVLLRNLDLSFNCLTELPKTLLQNTSDLLGLKLQSNQFSHISGTVFYHLPNLLDLDLSNNSLQYLPETIFTQSSSLVNIFLADNLLDEKVFESLRPAVSVQHIQLQQNKIEKLLYKILPEAFQLGLLVLNQNVISEIDPNAFIGMDVLQYLDMSDNRIDTLKREMFQPLSILAGIDLDQNPFVCSCDTKKFQDWLHEESASLTSPVTCYDPIFDRYNDIESSNLDYLCNASLSSGPCGSPCVAGATITLGASVTGHTARLTWDYTLISNSAVIQIDCKPLGEAEISQSFQLQINTSVLMIEHLEADVIYACCLMILKCDLYTCDAFTVDHYVSPTCNYLPYIISIFMVSFCLVVLIILFVVFVIKAKRAYSGDMSEKSMSIDYRCSPRTSVTVVSMDSSFNSGIQANQFEMAPNVQIRKRPLPNPNDRESTYDHIPLDFEQSGPSIGGFKNTLEKPSVFDNESQLKKETVSGADEPKKEVMISESQNITSTYLTPVDSTETIPRKPRRFVRPSKLNNKARGPQTDGNGRVKSASCEALNNSDGGLKNSEKVTGHFTTPAQQNSNHIPCHSHELMKCPNIRSTCPENILGDGKYGASYYQEISSDI